MPIFVNCKIKKYSKEIWGTLQKMMKEDFREQKKIFGTKNFMELKIMLEQNIKINYKKYNVFKIGPKSDKDKNDNI